MEGDFITIGELCEWLKISRRTTERWRKEGLPFIKQGRLVRFDKQVVVEWLKSKEVKN
ncbi:Helix-turn-helix domain protein [Pelotomaculum schinkii]|uniref:Helix-turn-helix domain protein n=1 Tax=Pelotomaculum schinkii TaxID=78350 RepID=A0A4Y7RJW8_9FIRM|nr:MULTISPECIES: helix-turn-helix domain-containing protein [Pelotomaculum]TEB08617.1 Helix-turn-helix domain protein [Pelotomaculum schinkii]TEB16812.1 Helix-turn-helix domain protein [Pelotomaculum sp. FP]